MSQENNLAPARGARVAIVVSKFNEPLTRMLLDGALARLAELDGSADVYWVPGAFEIPQAIAWLNAEDKWREKPQWEGYLALGCLIKGETDHYAVLAAEVTRRLGELAISQGVPLSFGVLTCPTLEQALERADPLRENKGGETMGALLEMIALRRQLAGG